jgi:excisionase family DNA binding protein
MHDATSTTSTRPPFALHTEKLGISVAECAQQLGVSRRLVYKLAQPGGPLTALRVGKRVVVLNAAIAAMIADAQRPSARMTEGEE